jgi:hypothetical protein
MLIENLKKEWDKIAKKWLPTLLIQCKEDFSQ